MADLICYGACNPTRRELDAEVVEFRRTWGKHDPGDKMMPIPDELRARLRLLKHTQHREVRFGVYACVVCLQERKWGHSFPG